MRFLKIRSNLDDLIAFLVIWTLFRLTGIIKWDLVLYGNMGCQVFKGRIQNCLANNQYPQRKLCDVFCEFSSVFRILILRVPSVNRIFPLRVPTVIKYIKITGAK